MRIFNRKSKHPTEAELARRKAEEQLERIKAETPAIRALARSLRELREQNHFVENIAASFRGEHT